ncbi:MAG: hypothetical protein RI996_404 [Candidatus Parcubacteria bacterium]|jgi:prophage antirepressor-like protein
MKKVIEDKVNTQKSGVVLYKTRSGGVELRVDNTQETVWATQAQIAEVFGVTPQNITMHLRNIYEQSELEEKATCKESLQVQNEGKRQVTRKVKEYNLEVLIAVGYRINSVIGTKFRQWATQTLKQHITKGYTINKHTIGENWNEFTDAVETIKKILPKEYQALTSEQTLDLVSLFARTWLSLDAYDKSSLDLKKPTKRSVSFTAHELTLAITDLKVKLIKKGEATELFAVDRNKDSIESIVGSVMQSFGGAAVYPSVEEKAAHLLYFIVKNHPFADGNKRSGAFAFVWFLEKCKRLDIGKMSPEALTALTLLVAESDPMNKENVVKLIMKLIEK